MIYKKNTMNKYKLFNKELAEIRRLCEQDGMSAEDIEKVLDTYRNEFKSDLREESHTQSLESISESLEQDTSGVFISKFFDNFVVYQETDSSGDILDDIDDEILFDLVAKLSEQDRQILSYMVSEMKAEQIAEILQISISKVYNRRKFIKEKLKPRLFELFPKCKNLGGENK